MPRITIVGLGFIGGSLGLALRNAKVACEVVGHDRDFQTAAIARRRGAIDRAEWNLPAALAGAGLVVVAVPLDAVPAVFRQIAPHLGQGCLVTDTASVKQAVLEWAAEALPPGASFVGGHPVAGHDGGGIDTATAALFVDRPYCLTPSASSDPAAVDLLVALATLVGARPYFLDAFEHDSLVAAVGHLPAIAAAALLRAVSGDATWTDAARLAAGQFGEVSRAASRDPAAFRALCRANHAALLRRLDAYGEQLAVLRRLIAAGDAGDGELENFFREANAACNALRPGAGAEPAVPELPRPGEQLRQLLLGRLRELRR